MVRNGALALPEDLARPQSGGSTGKALSYALLGRGPDFRQVHPLLFAFSVYRLANLPGEELIGLC